MNLKRRIQVSWLAITVIRIRQGYVWLILQPLVVIAKIFLAFTSRRSHRRVEALKRATTGLSIRVSSFCDDWQAISQIDDRHLAQIRWNSLSATRSSLLAEGERIQAAVAELRLPHPVWGTGGLSYLLASVQSRLVRIQRKKEALRRIFNQIQNSPTFYWDLLLWFAVPSSYSEELSGDLAEEYELRNTIDGEIAAKEWYQEQVIGTVMVHVWKALERLAAVGTLIDFCIRLFRNKG